MVKCRYISRYYTVAQRYLPGKERKSPYYLELILRLPPHSVTKVSIDMDYLFLKWQEYPPDANHGFYMGPAIITALLPIARNYTALPIDGSTITSRFVRFLTRKNRFFAACTHVFIRCMIAWRSEISNGASG